MTRGFAAVAALLSAVACRPEPSARDAAALALDACHLPGVGRPARCGWLAVPEERSAGGGSATIRLHIAMVPAHGDGPHEAVFLLAGGPGQAASEAFPQLWSALSPLGAHRDLVMIDQRGT